MGLKIRRTGGSDYGQATKALIAGFPGAGKTLLSSTWPKPFYASAEGGLMSIADRDIPYTDIRSVEDLLKLKTALDQPAHLIENLFGFPIETVVVDTIDEIQRVLIRERLEETKRDALALGDWNYIAEQMGAIVRGFRNLNLHVIFTCHLKEVTDSDTGRVSYKPQMQGGFADQIAANVDLALLLKTVTKTEQVNNKPEKVTRRFLQTQPDLAYEWIKDRSGKLPSEIDVDFTTDFDRINTWIFGGPKIKDTKVSEIQIDLPDLQPIKAPSEAVVRPMARRRPTVTSAPTPAPAAPVEPPVAEPELELDMNKATKLMEDLIPSYEPITVTSEPEPDYQEALDQVDTQESTVPAPAAEVSIPEVGPGEVLVRNPDAYQPPKGLKLIPCDHGTDLYCQNCGKEIESVRRSELSMVRFRAFLCETCFTDKKR